LTKWPTKAAALSAGCLSLLACAGPVRADIVALVARFSTPPPKAFLIDVSKDTIGGLKLDAPASTYVRKLGIPDYIGTLQQNAKVEMLWSRTSNPKTGWALATLRSPSSEEVTQLRYAGMFRTLQGDRRGTTLATFLKHWRLQGPVVTGVVSNGVLVEYNVVVGGVVFAFDQSRILEAVGLAPGATERTLCVIPSACIVTRIK
jgi:hypothetical protein